MEAQALPRHGMDDMPLVPPSRGDASLRGRLRPIRGNLRRLPVRVTRDLSSELGEHLCDWGFWAHRRSDPTCYV